MKDDSLSALRADQFARAVMTAALLLAACSSRGEPDSEPDPGVMCTMEARSAFAVSVLDAVTRTTSLRMLPCA